MVVGLQWVLATALWGLALAVLYTNVKRQKTNQAYYDEGSEKRVSGTPFIFSILCWVGVAISPWLFNAFWLITLIFELPALGNFITYSEEAEAKAKAKRRALLESNDD